MKRLATVRLLHQRLKLDMTQAAVNQALQDLSFRRASRGIISPGPEGSHHEVDSYFCSDGTVYVSYEYIAYGNKGDMAHVAAIAGVSVNTGRHFYEGDGNMMP